MTARSRRETITFKHPFRIEGEDRLLPAGAYEVITDKEMIEVVRLVSPRRYNDHGAGDNAAGSTMEMISISSIALSDAQCIDASASRE
jgi:hypothetical protein